MVDIRVSSSVLEALVDHLCGVDCECWVVRRRGKMLVVVDVVAELFSVRNCDPSQESARASIKGLVPIRPTRPL